jgi:hypothetical protein
MHAGASRGLLSSSAINSGGVDVNNPVSKRRLATIAAVSVGGGLAFSVTGGIAAPAIVSGLSSAVTALNLACGSASVAAASATVVGAAAAHTAALGYGIGAAGAGLTAYKAHRLTAGVDGFRFQPLPGACGWVGACK